MTVYKMRSEIAKVYPGEWKDKIARMPDYQIIAVYNSLLHRGKLGKPIPNIYPDESIKTCDNYNIVPCGFGFKAELITVDEFHDEECWEQIAFDGLE